jgi:hypothetical protein
MKIASIFLALILSTVCLDYSAGDFNEDEIVNFLDFSVFANEWLMDPNLLPDNTTRRETGAFTTFVVAPYNTSAQNKARADYVCDGVEDNIELQEAINTLPLHGGKVFLFNGEYNLGSGGLALPDFCVLEGESMEQTIIKGSASTVSAILNRNSVPLQMGVCGRGDLVTSPDHPAIGIVIRNLKVSGENMKARNGPNYYSYGEVPSDDPNNFGYKGIFINYLKNCLFENVWVYRTPATGIGNDSHFNCRYVNCRAEECGWARRTYSASNWWRTEYCGMYGFGLGYGGLSTESLEVVDCVALNNWHGGFGLEKTNSWYQSQGYVFRDCKSQGNQVGFKIWDMGQGNMFGCGIFGCEAYNNYDDGIKVFPFPNDVTIEGCSTHDNGGQGISIGDSTQAKPGYGPSSPGYEYRNDKGKNALIVGNTVKCNEKNGIWVYADQVSIIGNNIHHNHDNGILPCPQYQDVNGLFILGNQIGDNGSDSTDKDGIALICQQYHNIRNVIVSGNRCYDSGATTIRGGLTVTRSSNVATVKKSSGDIGVISGERVDIVCNNDPSFNATGAVITITELSSFTYSNPGNNATSPVCVNTVTRNRSQRYGIYAESKSGQVLTDVIIAHNNLCGNMIAGYEDSSVAHSNLRLTDNIGYITESSGGRIGTGAEQTIPHALDKTPTTVIISGDSSDVNGYQSRAADETNIYITADDGEAYHWTALVR